MFFSFPPMRFPLLLPVALATPVFAVVNIDYVTVGNSGNAADPATGSLYGAVAYEYKIARNETTLSQYAEFLNATAATDPYGLYNTNMASNGNIAGIARSGTSGNYSYSVIGSGDRPVTYVYWFDAARFVNWMHNGQGNGSTETGVYNLNGANSGIFIAQAGATVWLPTEDEWYKAAYYDPTKGDGGGYWRHANQSDSMTSNNISVAGAANYFDGNYGKSENGWSSILNDVGAYGVDSQSYYGTNDQAGNVWEWNDAIIGPWRGLRGGSSLSFEPYLRSTLRTTPLDLPQSDYNIFGFRVASVPEPGYLVLTAVASGAMLSRRKR